MLPFIPPRNISLKTVKSSSTLRIQTKTFNSSAANNNIFISDSSINSGLPSVPDNLFLKKNDESQGKGSKRLSKMSLSQGDVFSAKSPIRGQSDLWSPKFDSTLPLKDIEKDQKLPITDDSSKKMYDFNNLDDLISYSMDKADIAVALDQNGSFIPALTFYREAIIGIEKFLALSIDFRLADSNLCSESPEKASGNQWGTRKIFRRNLSQVSKENEISADNISSLTDADKESLISYRNIYLNRIEQLLIYLPVESHVFYRLQPFIDNPSLWKLPEVSNTKDLELSDDSTAVFQARSSLLNSSCPLNIPSYQPISVMNVICRPFALMESINNSIQRGSFIAPNLYIPKELWALKNIKLLSIEMKTNCLESLFNYTDKIKDINRKEPMALLYELEIFEQIVDKFKSSLKKKIRYLDLESNDNFDHIHTGHVLSHSPSMMSLRKKEKNPFSKSIEKFNNSSKSEDISDYIQFIQLHFSQVGTLRSLLNKSEEYKDLNLGTSNEGAHIHMKMKKIVDFYAEVVCGFVLADLLVLHETFVKKTRIMFE